MGCWSSGWDQAGPPQAIATRWLAGEGRGGEGERLENRFTNLGGCSRQTGPEVMGG